MTIIDMPKVIVSVYVLDRVKEKHYIINNSLSDNFIKKEGDRSETCAKWIRQHSQTTR